MRCAVCGRAECRIVVRNSLNCRAGSTAGSLSPATPQRLGPRGRSRDESFPPARRRCSGCARCLRASGPLRGSCRGEPDLQDCQWQVRARRQALSHHGRVDPLLPGRPGAVGGQAAAAPRHGAERRRGKEPRRHRHSRLARETARTVQRPQAPCLRPRAVPRARLGSQVYVFWNWHQAQPGPADFSTPSRQLAKFLQLAKEAGLVVMLRVGPYGCGEWNGKVAPRHGPAAAGPGTNGAELPAASSLVGAKWRLSPAWGPLAAPVHGLLRARKQARPTRVLATRSCC